MKTKYLISVAGLCLGASAAMADVPELTVLTYDSFASEWGPGPAIKAGFETVCDCTVTYQIAIDGAAILSRLSLEGGATKVDVAVGLDSALTAAARASGFFAPSGVDEATDLPVAWNDDIFVPFDWGYFAFVADADTPAPDSLRELADSDLKVVIEDPRSSTPGLGLILWAKSAYGDGAGALWADMADNILTVTPGWSEAYGLFLNGEADAVLSYTTSPAYHIIAEGDAGKVAWRFDEGQYMQIEVAAALASSDAPGLARDFLRYLQSDAVQALIPTTNWMYPVRMPEGGLPTGFDDPAAVVKPLLMTEGEAAALHDTAIEEWRAALAR